jgi:hypothetical protein
VGGDATQNNEDSAGRAKKKVIFKNRMSWRNETNKKNQDASKILGAISTRQPTFVKCCAQLIISMLHHQWKFENKQQHHHHHHHQKKSRKHSHNPFACHVPWDRIRWQVGGRITIFSFFRLATEWAVAFTQNGGQTTFF